MQIERAAEASDTPPPSPQMLVDLARDMVPELRELAPENESNRRLSRDTVQKFRDAGFMRVYQPKRYGGLEMDYGIHMKVAAELGRGCASSAWVSSVLSAHALILGMFPEEVQDKVWEDDPEALIATSFLPSNPDIRQTNEGLIVNGTWKFSSGIEFCRWIVLLMPSLSGVDDDLKFALFPLGEGRIEDTWYVNGLAGTGSNDIVLEDAFIPYAHLVDISDLRGGTAPGSEVNDSHIYKLPLWSTFAFTLVGPALGAARGALENIADGLTDRKSVGQVKLSEQQSVQQRIAYATAQLDAAEASLLLMLDRINKDGKRGIIPDMEPRVRYRLNVGFAADLCVQAMEKLFPLLGGRGLAADDPVQRAWRDVHAIAQHIGLVWDLQAGLYGAVKLGLPCPDPKI